jgi:hypothetical protein
VNVILKFGSSYGEQGFSIICTVSVVTVSFSESLINFSSNTSEEVRANINDCFSTIKSTIGTLN